MNCRHCRTFTRCKRHLGNLTINFQTFLHSSVLNLKFTLYKTIFWIKTLVASVSIYWVTSRLGRVFRNCVIGYACTEYIVAAGLCFGGFSIRTKVYLFQNYKRSIWLWSEWEIFRDYWYHVGNKCTFERVTTY